MYRDEVDAFQERLKKRARDKIEAALTEAEAEAKQKRIEESPGGLDPQEVFDTLPEVVLVQIFIRLFFRPCKKPSRRKIFKSCTKWPILWTPRCFSIT